MCLLFLSLFHSAPTPASMYVYHHIWRNNKFYWNYFIDKLMFALCIQNAQTCWTTMTMTAQTECKRELKRHLRQPLLPNIRISYGLNISFSFTCSRTRSMRSGLLMAFIVKKGKRIEREIKFYDIYYVYMVVHIFICLSPLKLNCVSFSLSLGFSYAHHFSYCKTGKLTTMWWEEKGVTW